MLKPKIKWVTGSAAVRTLEKLAHGSFLLIWYGDELVDDADSTIAIDVWGARGGMEIVTEAVDDDWDKWCSADLYQHLVSHIIRERHPWFEQCAAWHMQAMLNQTVLVEPDMWKILEKIDADPR